MQVAEMKISARPRSSQRECNGQAKGLQSQAAGSQRASKDTPLFKAAYIKDAHIQETFPD